MDCGPTVIAHLLGDVAAAALRVRVGVRLEEAGQAVLIAFPASTDVSVGLEDLYPGDLAWEWFDGK